jgi:hypothetical protein
MRAQQATFMAKWSKTDTYASPFLHTRPQDMLVTQHAHQIAAVWWEELGGKARITGGGTGQPLFESL